MAQQEQFASSGDAWGRVKSRLRAELGEDVFASWFRGVELERLDEGCVHLTVATRFLRNWLRSHYYDFVLRLFRSEWAEVDRVEFRVRQPHFGNEQPKEMLRQKPIALPAVEEMPPLPMPLRTGYGGFEGSPLDPRLTFTTFLVGASNRLAHAAAQEVAGAFSTPQQLFNPLFVHGSVGLGKTHLLHAQMVGVHWTAMELLRQIGERATAHLFNDAGSLAVKLLRTYAAQIEALKRYRSAGEQRVVVQHVNVTADQAAVQVNANAAPRGEGDDPQIGGSIPWTAAWPCTGAHGCGARTPARDAVPVAGRDRTSSL